MKDNITTEKSSVVLRDSENNIIGVFWKWVDEDGSITLVKR